MIKAKHLGNLKMKASVRDFEIISDIVQEDGGDGSAPEPADLMCSALALCAGTYFALYCKKRDVDPGDFEVILDYEWGKAPKKVEKFTVNFKFPEGFPEKYKKAATKFVTACSVGNTFKNGAKVEYNFS